MYHMNGLNILSRLIAFSSASPRPSPSPISLERPSSLRLLFLVGHHRVVIRLLGCVSNHVFTSFALSPEPHPIRATSTRDDPSLHSASGSHPDRNGPTSGRLSTCEVGDRRHGGIQGHCTVLRGSTRVPGAKGGVSRLHGGVTVADERSRHLPPGEGTRRKRDVRLTGPEEAASRGPPILLG